MAAGFERRARRLLTMVTGPRCRFLVSVAAIAAAGLGGACGQAPQHRAEAGAAGKVEKVEQRVAALEDPCPPPTDVCRVQPGTRDAVTGECSYPPALNGTSCDDGQ